MTSNFVVLLSVRKIIKTIKSLVSRTDAGVGADPHAGAALICAREILNGIPRTSGSPRVVGVGTRHTDDRILKCGEYCRRHQRLTRRNRSRSAVH